MQVSASRRIASSPGEVWALVSDVTRVGEYSPETFEAVWHPDTPGPALGARFKGHVRRNEVGPVYWSACEVTAFEDGRTFGFDVVGPEGRPWTHWRYDLEPVDDGTLLTESMHLYRSNPLLALYDVTVGRLRRGYNERNIATSLARIAAVLEGTPMPSATARRGTPLDRAVDVLQGLVGRG